MALDLDSHSRGQGGAAAARLRSALLGVLGLALATAGISAGLPQKAEAAMPAACAALQAKYPSLKGKTRVNAINPHTPGYETIDPADPTKYIGFDIDLGEAIGECLGFKLTYKPVTFAALLTTLQAEQADIVISDIYATKERAKAADFITYLKVFDGVLVAKGNPKGIDGINLSLCGAVAAENTEFGADGQSEVYAKSSLDLAMRDAFRKVRRFLMTTKGLSEDEAIALVSAAVDFGITQVVDGNWGVHAILSKRLFPDRN